MWESEYTPKADGIGDERAVVLIDEGVSPPHCGLALNTPHTLQIDA